MDWKGEKKRELEHGIDIFEAMDCVIEVECYCQGLPQDIEGQKETDQM